MNFSLGEANLQKVKLINWKILVALNHLQEPRDIKTMQCKHRLSHFIDRLFSIHSIKSNFCSILIHC